MDWTTCNAISFSRFSRVIYFYILFVLNADWNNTNTIMWFSAQGASETNSVCICKACIENAAVGYGLSRTNKFSNSAVQCSYASNEMPLLFNINIGIALYLLFFLDIVWVLCARRQRSSRGFLFCIAFICVVRLVSDDILHPMNWIRTFSSTYCI